MRKLFQLKEKIWSFGGNYVIRDENEEPVYAVKGKVFSWGKDLSFQDYHTGEEIFRIKQILMSFMPRFEILKDGEPLAEIRKEFQWFGQKFTLDVPGPNDYTIEGSFWQREFEFRRASGLSARVSKAFWNWTDTYGIEIYEGDEAFILATAIVIDLVLFEKKSN
ncbi:LURP-one-related family protein [Saprospira sp. CCB-QB6]|uniref:LURP-one-related/scramblase family protein n=1 Tax=Saprospira sp. CCB-QB6 TaxID=3023936 RepID=UPI0023493A82|nr:LURP-one-related family protein [Saprospira sp. CCB-QB6]WCL81200.1 LURP-one-related family protein [Saprospira sp. CCB-QB6]